MGSHPPNLALRFLLEMAALVAIGYWGFDQHSGIWRFVIGIGGPMLAAVLWGTFAAWALYDAGSTLLAELQAGITIVHYALSYDRVAWLLRTKGTEATPG
jgi:hypothetical protein